MVRHRLELPLCRPRRRPDVRRLSRDRHAHAHRRLSGGAQERQRGRRDLHRRAVSRDRDHHRRGAELTRRPPACDALVLTMVIALAPDTARAQGKRDANRYDQTFRKYSKRYFGIGYDWRIFKAQALAESEMNPNARSWERDSIATDRREFMFASYNAGEGTILNAQRACVARSLDRRAWTSVETVAPEVPRWRYRETLGYVRKIRSGMDKLDEKGRVKKSPPAKR